MATHDNRHARRGGYSLIHALIGVVAFGVGATVAIPRIWAARAEAMDVAAIAELNRATSLVNGYQQRYGSLPGTAGEAGFEEEAGVEVTLWKRRVVAGVESVHVHVRHRASRHSFHAHYPLEGAIRMLPYER